MTSIQILSDLHLEFSTAKYPKISASADVIVLAGDINISPHTVKHFLKHVRTKTKSPIIYVLGNHEYYRQKFPNIAEHYKALETKIPNLYVLNQESVIVADIRFIGATLWTFMASDIGKYAESCINDYKLISKDNPSPEGVRRITTITHRDTTDAWHKATSWISKELDKPCEFPTVVVTHHAPSFRSVEQKHIGDPMNAAFYSNLESLIEYYQPAMWIHGHMHGARVYKIDATMIVCNPKGYPSERGTNGFIEDLVIDLESLDQEDN